MTTLAVSLAATALAAPPQPGRHYVYDVTYTVSGGGYPQPRSTALKLDFMVASPGQVVLQQGVARSGGEAPQFAYTLQRIAAAENKPLLCSLAASLLPHVDRQTLAPGDTWEATSGGAPGIAAGTALTARVLPPETGEGRRFAIVSVTPRQTLPIASGASRITKCEQKLWIDPVTGDVHRSHLIVEAASAAGSVLRNEFDVRLKQVGAYTDTALANRLAETAAVEQLATETQAALTGGDAVALNRVAAQLEAHQQKYRQSVYAGTVAGLQERIAPKQAAAAGGPARRIQRLPVAQIGGAAPAIRLSTVDRKPVDLDSYLGKVVLLNFFATWCGPCNVEAPIIERDFHRRYPSDQFAVLAVDMGEQGDPYALVRDFRARHGLTYPALMDVAGVLDRPYRIEAFPTNIVIDQNGVIRYMQAGFDDQGIHRLIRELLRG